MAVKSYCRQCGKHIGTRFTYDYDYKTGIKSDRRPYGWAGTGDGLFCKLECARRWAVARLGGRIIHPDVVEVPDDL